MWKSIYFKLYRSDNARVFGQAWYAVKDGRVYIIEKLRKRWRD